MCVWPHRTRVLHHGSKWIRPWDRGELFGPDSIWLRSIDQLPSSEIAWLYIQYHLHPLTKILYQLKKNYIHYRPLTNYIPIMIHELRVELRYVKSLKTFPTNVGASSSVELLRAAYSGRTCIRLPRGC